MIAVTGATGYVGGRTAARVAERGAPLRLVVRKTRLPPAHGVAGGRDRRAGELERVSDTVERLSGRAPLTLREIELA